MPFAIDLSPRQSARTLQQAIRHRAEVLLDFIARIKLERLGQVQAQELRPPALVIEPLLDDGLVFDDPNAGLIDLEGHVREAVGVEAGFVGPVGLSIRIIADACLRTGCYVVGANKPDAHLRGVVPGWDFQAEFADLHEANAGDGCGRCGAPLAVERVIEVGNIFKLGTKYSVPLRAVYLDEQGQERPIVMGSYGIGPARIAAAAIEQNHDKDGIIWPETIAPFQIHLLVVNTKEPKMATLGEQLYADLTGAELEILYDDRDMRPGVKFKDADLLGLPLRITVGSRAVKEGVVEIRRRRTGEEIGRAHV
jgi:prolyl-tRNA synthetase